MSSATARGRQDHGLGCANATARVAQCGIEAPACAQRPPRHRGPRSRRSRPFPGPGATTLRALRVGLARTGVGAADRRRRPRDDDAIPSIEESSFYSVTLSTSSLKSRGKARVKKINKNSIGSKNLPVTAVELPFLFCRGKKKSLKCLAKSVAFTPRSQIREGVKIVCWWNCEPSMAGPRPSA